MTFQETTQALREYEDVLQEHGADVVRRLHPGLTREDALHAAEKRGLFLTEDALALWMWHDGDASAESSTNSWCGDAGIVASLSFPSLGDALDIALKNPVLKDSRKAAPGSIIDVYLLPVATLWGEPHISLHCTKQNPDVMEDAPMPVQDTLAFYGDAYVVDDSTHTIPFAQMVRSWTRYVQMGYWKVYPDGQLREDQYWGLPGHSGEQEVKDLLKKLDGEE
ncbi:MAG: hypothetical protein PUF51_05180 [Bifidobacteriaceae bacterium]|nr:hypothetical protein [Bifidobacteriaceae bacterium]